MQSAFSAFQICNLLNIFIHRSAVYYTVGIQEGNKGRILHIHYLNSKIMTTDQVCAEFAGGSRTGHTPNRIGYTGYCTSVFIEGDTIYSYGHHFPMAKQVITEDGERLFWFNTDSYSVTTSKHQSKLRMALYRTGCRIIEKDTQGMAGVPKQFSNEVQNQFLLAA